MKLGLAKAGLFFSWGALGNNPNNLNTCTMKESKNKMVRAEKYYGYTVLDSGAILSRIGEFKQMKTKTDINGHVVLNLCHPTWKLMPCGMRVRTKQVSRLVAQAFLGLDIDDVDTCVMHRDGNLNNNSYDNLYLANRSQAVKFRFPIEKE